MNYDSPDLDRKAEFAIPPGYALVPAPASATEWEPSVVGDWPKYWVIIRRHWAALTLLTTIVTSLTAIAVFRMPPMFESTAVVRVDPSAPTNVVGDSANSAPMPANADTLILTEASEAGSAAIVAPTILKLHLQSLPELQAAMRSVPPLNDDTGPVPMPMVRAFLSRVKVSQQQFTYLLNIGFRSRSPELSAQVANELARQLIAHEYASRSEALLSSSQYMTGQLEDLRANMERSQQTLSQFEQANNIVNPGDKFDVMNERLTMLAKSLEEDRARLRQVEAESTLARIGSVDALAVTDRGEALKPLLDADQAQQVKMAQIAAKYGPGHFLYRQAQRQTAELDASVDRERQHLRAQVQAEAMAARQRVNLTEQAFRQQKQAIQQFNRKALAFGALKNEADTDLRLYTDLLQRLKAAQIAAGYHADQLRIVGLARPDPTPVSPPRVLAIILAFLLSSGAGIGTVLAGAHFNRGLADAADARRWLGEPVLASLPRTRHEDELRGLLARSGAAGYSTAKDTPLLPNGFAPSAWRKDGLEPALGGGATGITPRRQRSAFAEAIFSLRTALWFGSAQRLRAVSLTSAQPQEGKSTIAANLACACALHGVSTVLLDADLRRPEIHRAFDLPNHIGLSTLLRHECGWEEAVRETHLAHLYVLPAGPAVTGEPELLAGGFALLLEQLKSRFDVVIVDCPPLLGFSDALTVSSSVDAVLLVVRAGRTPRELVLSALEQLRHIRARLGGVVLNDAHTDMNAYYAYYLRSDRGDRSHMQADEPAQSEVKA